jgi:hypothetical protein
VRVTSAWAAPWSNRWPGAKPPLLYACEVSASSTRCRDAVPVAMRAPPLRSQPESTAPEFLTSWGAAGPVGDGLVPG